ncbi:MAG: 16S rRNA (guanine(527)-N(7))-methyltransferase RsmG [Pseudobdellovibrionaceae bacterium]
MRPNVSRETEEKLLAYEALLKKWQSSINLVSLSTLPYLRERHIDDSLQLVEHLPFGAKTLCDFGSGAGFPALVLAMSCPDISVTMIESDQRKCAFLKTVSRETSLANATIFNSRIESLEAYLSYDVFSARALAPLVDLFSFMEFFPEHEKSTALFLKGETVESEIQEAEKIFDFEYVLHTSKTHSAGRIIEVRSLTRKCA